MMRVLALTNLFPSPWLPNRATFNRQQFSALAGMHPLHIIAPVSWTDQLRHQRDAKASSMAIQNGVIVEHPKFLFTPGCFRQHHGRFYVHSIRKTFERAVTQFEPDVVLAAWAYPDVYAAAQLCREARLPLVAKVHGSDVLLLKDGSRRQKQTADALFAADAVITVSQHLANAVHALGVPSHRIHTVYNGIDTALFHSNTSSRISTETGSVNLLFVGNLVDVKGIDTLIDACALLRRQGIKFECQIVGTGPLRSRLIKQIRASSLTRHVSLGGAKSLAELVNLYRAASVLVVPSRSEGVPNVVLEALACGTPVVASRVGGIPEVLDAHSLVEPNDPAALADAIVRQLRSPYRGSFQPRSWQQSAFDLANVLDLAIRKTQRMAA